MCPSLPPCSHPERGSWSSHSATASRADGRARRLRPGLPGAGRRARPAPTARLALHAVARWMALGSAAAMLLACASDARSPHPDLARVWRWYLTLPAERALAIAGDPRRDRWVIGASGG